MKSIIGYIFFLPIALSAQPGITPENSVVRNSVFKNIQDSIESKINRSAIPSFSVAVSKAGKVIWQQSFGWADKEKKVIATPSTTYAIASLSKSITSTALMILVESGSVNLNDPVEKYLGDASLTYFNNNVSRVTISQLMNMTGGIPHQWQYFYSDEKKQPQTIGSQIKHSGLVVFPPGEVFQYSNFSFGIIEQVIQNVSGLSLREFMQKRLFIPLKMNHAAVIRSDPNIKNIAKGYTENGELLTESEFFPKAGAGYYASAEDLINYGMFHLKDKSANRASLLKDENIDILHEPVAYTYLNNFYAFGWGVLKIGNSKTSLLSNGAIDGAASSLLLLPESDIAIACITNATVGNEFTDQIAFSIADRLIPGYLDDLQQFIEKITPAFADQPFHSNDSITGAWEGVIITRQDSIPIRMIFEKDNRVLVKIQNQFETILNNIVVANGLIQGQCYGNIDVPETAGTPHYLQIVLKPGVNEMFGSISAQSFNTRRIYFLIPFYIWLKKSELK